jgi:hypothetical protein
MRGSLRPATAPKTTGAAAARMFCRKMKAATASVAGRSPRRTTAVTVKG